MFTGFTDETVDFMWGIRFNNERAWFEAHKDTYLTQFYQPMRELGDELYDFIRDKRPNAGLIRKVSRIYRDARRLYGRGPYKSHLWFSLRMAGEHWAEQPVFWFEIYPEGYSYGLGIYQALPATMARFRQAVDRDPREMRKLAQAFQAQDRFRLEAEEYKRPKGCPEPPLDQWYNRKSLDLTCSRPADDLLYSPALVGELTEAFESLMPYHRYFSALCLRAD